MRRWRSRHLLLGWITYWVLLALFALGPAALAFQRVAAKPHGKLAVTAGLENDDLYLTVADAGATAWHGAVPFSEAVLWVVVPPLLLWLLWLGIGAGAGARARAERIRG